MKVGQQSGRHPTSVVISYEDRLSNCDDVGAVNNGALHIPDVGLSLVLLFLTSLFLNAWMVFVILLTSLSLVCHWSQWAESPKGTSYIVLSLYKIRHTTIRVRLLTESLCSGSELIAVSDCLLMVYCLVSL